MSLPASVSQFDVLRDAVRGASSYLEIGVQEGRSLRAVLDAEPGISRLVLCDTWGTVSGGSGRGSHAHIEALLDESGFEGSVEWLDGRSQDLVLGHFKTADPVDVSHVDGEHTEQAALTDCLNAWAVTRRSMIVHDIAFPQVWRSCLAFLSDCDGEARCYAGGHGTLRVDRAAA